MDPDTIRGDGDGGGDVYWRRRMSVLIAVLVVVAVVAWACSSGADGPQRSSSAESSAGESPSADPLLAGLRTLALGTATPTPQPSPNRDATPAAAAAAAGAGPDRPGQPCAEDDLVLSLQGKQDVYTGGAWPNFLVTLVNTGPVMCRADVGPRALEVRITSGEDRIWSTADCVSGPAGEQRELERGIPYVRTLDWDRRRSSADCRTTPASALPGTYVAVARMGKLKSPKGVFHLR
ncbi:hypothetical protein HTZ77_14015 [Nonomuraea sp. SMC257]|uniref:DUF4232 domain-containing protein n=1 Tax=Nonomuraea montanisoli TaxID=2741721 RepID=A0A7Y6M3S9_9ACTN|nr:hypothetical protein [Nonomuraea montanisoli]NUW32539.1 hypothetical protein [Nonomuraea montanisoli]